MAENDTPVSPLGDVSRDKPRMLERVSDGARTRVTDPLEYANLTTGQGYRDVTDAKPARKSSGGSSNTGTGSGGTPTTDNTTSK